MLSLYAQVPGVSPTIGPTQQTSGLFQIKMCEGEDSLSAESGKIYIKYIYSYTKITIYLMSCSAKKYENFFSEIFFSYYFLCVFFIHFL